MTAHADEPDERDEVAARRRFPGVPEWQTPLVDQAKLTLEKLRSRFRPLRFGIIPIDCRSSTERIISEFEKGALCRLEFAVSDAAIWDVPGTCAPQRPSTTPPPRFSNVQSGDKGLGFSTANAARAAARASARRWGDRRHGHTNPPGSAPRPTPALTNATMGSVMAYPQSVCSTDLTPLAHFKTVRERPNIRGALPVR
jgi:hypothetical protein